MHTVIVDKNKPSGYNVICRLLVSFMDIAGGSMKIDISLVKTVPGTELEIYESAIIPSLKDINGTVSVNSPVTFKGVLTNQNELLSLEGEATCVYETQCDYCIKPITRSFNVTINEALIETEDDGESMTESDEYTYQGNWIVLDKILFDNIVLSIPMHHRCDEECKIICPKCGEPVTGTGCGCYDRDPVDPRLAPLKKLVNNKNANDAN